MQDETEFFEYDDDDEGADIFCVVCRQTTDLIFEDNGTIICEECLREYESE